MAPRALCSRQPSSRESAGQDRGGQIGQLASLQRLSRALDAEEEDGDRDCTDAGLHPGFARWASKRATDKRPSGSRKESSTTKISRLERTRDEREN